LKATVRDERGNVSRYVTAFEQPVRNRLRLPLPAPYSGFGSKPVFKKDEPPAWLKHTSNTSNGLKHARNRAQREGADHRIDGTVFQRDAFARKVQELNFKIGKNF